MEKQRNMPPNPQNLKPFVPGDKRINRDGRPTDSVSLATLIRRIGHEIATTKDKSGAVVQVIGPDGKPMTVIETILRQRAQDKRYQGEFIDRGWGKVPTSVEVSGMDDGPIQIMITRKTEGNDSATPND